MSLRVVCLAGVVVGTIAALAHRRSRDDAAYYDPANPRHRDPRYVLIDDGYLVEEPGLIEPPGSRTLGASAEQQTRTR
jgi:hypothetical protein